METGLDGPDPEVAEKLARISAALGLPMSVFFGAASAMPPYHGADGEAESDLLKLIEAHLRQARPEERGRFLASVEALLHPQSR